MPIGKCIICLAEGPLTREHIIPKALGGLWAEHILCKACNDSRGLEGAGLKRNYEIRQAYEALRNVLPAELVENLDARQKFHPTREGLAVSRDGSVPLPEYIRQGTKFVLIETPTVFPTEDADRRLRPILSKLGVDSRSSDDWIRDFEPLESKTLPDGSDVVKSEPRGLEPTFDHRTLLTETRPDGTEGLNLNGSEVLKIAYEFLFLCIGDRILDPELDIYRQAIDPGLDKDPERRSRRLKLLGTVRVESKFGRRPQPFHSLRLKNLQAGCYPVVWVVLFGFCCYVVHFEDVHPIAETPLRSHTVDLVTKEWSNS